MFRFSSRLLLAGLALLQGSSALADGVVRDSVGATSSGRGGANIAHSDNGAILLDNPAAMVNISGRGLFEFSIDSVVTDLEYRDPENDESAEFQPSALPEFSLISKSRDGRWAAGLGVFVPAGFGASWKLTNPLLGSNSYDSFGALGKIIPGVAVQVTDRLSVGGTFGLAVSHAELETPFFLQTGPLAGAPTILDLQATGATYTWSVGAQYQVGDRTTVGAAYTSKTDFNLDGTVRADVFGLGASPVRSRFDADVELAWPASVGIGIKHDISCCQRVSVDVVWYDWSDAFDTVDIKLTNPSHPAIPLPVIRDRLPLNWNDSVSTRVGYERIVFNGDVLRLGYVHNSQTIPSSTLTPLIPAILEHSISAGYGTSYRDWDIDFAYQFAFGPERDVQVSGVVGGDFNASEVEARAHWAFLSFRREF